jgi:hypothetical protein
LSWTHPYVFLALLVLALVVMVGTIVLLGKFLAALARRVSGWFAARQPSM